MRDFHIVAESTIHQGRRLLISDQGKGYIQLDRNTLPIPLPERDFARFQAMHHYRPVTPAWATGQPQQADVLLAR